MAENNLPPGFVCSINIRKNPEKTPGNETYESGKTKPDFVLTTRYVEKLKKDMPATFKIVGLEGYHTASAYIQEDGSLKISVKQQMKKGQSAPKQMSAADDFLNL